ncbi:MAG: L,D-transpeptidase [Rubrivivax sp.]|nr:L,D-transpeptidase [Pyrinomonadaceae bacterium]
MLLLVSLSICALLVACAVRGGELPFARAQTPTPVAGGPLRPEEVALNSRPLKLPLADAKIVVRKTARRLTLYAGGEAVRVYPVVLGFEPVGDKEKQGDGRTPEGTFYVCVKNSESSFHVSLGLNYPDAGDAERGLRDRLITREQSDQIKRANAKKETPPWDTPLGGEIFIHGGGTASDWTWGCIALENENIKELFDAVPSGATVVIEH